MLKKQHFATSPHNHDRPQMVRSYVFSHFCSNCWLIFRKFWEARSRLYRSQMLQVNIRWKALDEIYKICMLLHRSNLNISEKFRQTFPHFSTFFNIQYFSLNFGQILMILFRNFADISENGSIFWMFSIFWRKFLNFARILTELWSEKFEWFGPSPIEPFN